ncbi:MAG: preprotein translocase subunit YajC [Longimicrobiaceae bacterium]
MNTIIVGTGLLAQANGGSALVQFIPLIAFIAIIYFLFIMPHRREQKRHREMLQRLKKGDRIVSAGGLVGEILHLTDDEVTLKTGESRVVLERARVAGLRDDVTETGKG